MIKNFERTRGPKAGARAVLHEYEGKTAKIEIEVSLTDARSIMEHAVSAAGNLPIKIGFGGTQIEAYAVGARIDSYGSDGARIGGTGVIDFSSLKEKS